MFQIEYRVFVSVCGKMINDNAVDGLNSGAFIIWTGNPMFWIISPMTAEYLHDKIADIKRNDGVEGGRFAPFYGIAGFIPRDR